MEILIVTTVSGTMNFFETQIKEMLDKGIKVHLATNFKVGEIRFETGDLIKHQIDFSRSVKSKENIKAYTQLKTVTENNNFNVIHTHTPIASTLIRLQRIKKTTKIYYTAHGFHFYKGAPKKNWLIYYIVEKLLAYRTDKLIVINEEDYEIAKNKFKMKELILINGPGVDLNLIQTLEPINRASLGMNESDFILIFGAELNKNKNQYLLIDAVKILNEKYSNIKLLLVGKDNYDNKYQEYVKQLGLERSVKFLGLRSDLKRIIKSCDLALSSSKREGLGLFLIEALASGIPVIATDNRGSKEIIVDGKNGFLVGFNDVEMANKIEEIYLDSALLKSLSTGASENLEKFSRESINERVMDLYYE
ncbi:glycosyltransferase family 4 protein [Vagococcus fluvialis]|uniref:glycosyltransferase family 4 protein n=1 Tax=Vagococcus fluvialis TaxID=2738 RepID=UPI0022E8E2C4|nr:glycosyltransferase family 4 protein [Vagococcus fluvialis]